MSDVTVSLLSENITLTVSDPNNIQVITVSPGPTGPQGIQGPPGPGLDAGGVARQVPIKASATDYDTEWGALAVADITGLTEALLHPTPDYLSPHPGLAAPPYQEGRIYYDSVTKTLNYYTDINDVSVNIGQELHIKAINKTGVTIPNGAVVYISGAQGMRPTITLASASVPSTARKTIGVVTSNIGNNQEGYVTTFGVVHDLDTSAFPVGSEVWLSTVAGTFTLTKPVAPIHSVLIGYVVVSHAVNGTLQVNIQNGTDLVDVHDVLISAVSDRHFFQYNQGLGVWQNVPAFRSTITTRTTSGSASASRITRYTGPAGSTEVLPPATGSGVEKVYRNSNALSASWTVAADGADQIDLGMPLTLVTSFTLLPGQSVTLVDVDSGKWEAL